jgi:hypothetical protein
MPRASAYPFNVRIAFSGSHRYEFAAPPSLEDFEAQLERSVMTVEAREPDVLFDRCPLRHPRLPPPA